MHDCGNGSTWNGNKSSGFASFNDFGEGYFMSVNCIYFLSSSWVFVKDYYVRQLIVVNPNNCKIYFLH